MKNRITDFNRTCRRTYLLSEFSFLDENITHLSVSAQKLKLELTSLQFNNNI